jgi:hypothetical protein
MPGEGRARGGWKGSVLSFVPSASSYLPRCSDALRTPLLPPSLPPSLPPRAGQLNTYFNFKAIAGWLFSSFFQSAVILVLVLTGCSATTISRQGGDVFGSYEVGVLMFSCIILVVHLEISSIIEQWTWIHHFSIWGSQRECGRRNRGVGKEVWICLPPSQDLPSSSLPSS